jgi:hypothetical protein
MNPKHCVSLELAKQLDKAGWKKETEFVWAIGREDKKAYLIEIPSGDTMLELEKPTKGKHYIQEISKLYPAPLATEILEELPDYTTIYRIGKGNKCWHCLTEKDDLKLADTLLNVLAKMWLYLRKEKK